MMKGVFICKLQGRYDDCPEERYHFPRQYLDRVKAVVGDWIVYYESRRDGGRMVYFATAQVWDIEPDPLRPDHYYALVRHYLDFDEPVPFRENGEVYERSLLNPDGSVNPGRAQSAVHHIADDEYYAIFHRGFSRAVVADPQEAGAPVSSLGIAGFAEPLEDFERPLVEQLVRRPFRDRAFSEAVRRTYDYTCAITGWCLRNGGGRPEVQAAHIQPVAAHGPDSIRNGLALSGTVHWMFDRGLISLTDDYRLIKAKGAIPPALDQLLPADHVRVPPSPANRPAARYLRFHREHIFKG